MKKKTSKNKTAPTKGSHNTKTALIRKEGEATTALSTASISADDIMSDSQGDFAGASQDDFAIPRLSILQDLSPQTKSSKAEFVKGAKPGMLFDNVAQRFYDAINEPIYMVFWSYRRTYIEWKKNREGFVRDHGNTPEIMDQCFYNEDVKGWEHKETGNLIVCTAEYAAFIVDPETGEYSPVMVSMAKSQFKKAKALNTAMSTLRFPCSKHKEGVPGTFKPAMYYSVFQVQTKPESSDEGDWFGWDIQRHGDVFDIPGGEAIYKDAKSWRDNLASGAVKVASMSEDHGGSGKSRSKESDDSPM